MPLKNPEEKRIYDREYQRTKRAGKQAPLTRGAGPFGYVTKDGRVVRKDLLDQYAFKGGNEVSTQIKADRFMGDYREAGLIQPLYNPETLATISEINSYHARACHVKARDTAGHGWRLVGKGENPREAIRDEIETFLTRQITPLTTTLYRHQLDIEVVGHGGIEIVREGYLPTGRPRIIAHVPGHTLRIHAKENRYAQRRDNRIRWFKRINYEMDVHKETGAEYELGTLPPEQRAAELLWNASYSQRSDYYGIPDIIPALGAIHGDLARRDFNIAFFDNFGVPAYAVFITGDYDPGEKDADGVTELERTIEMHFKEMAKNPHATLVLAVPTMGGVNGGDVKIEFKPLAIEIKDASFRLFRKDNRDEVISAHGVPPYRLGIAETGSLGGSTATESTEIYKMSVINPRQDTLEAMINQHLIWHPDGFDAPEWTFVFNEIDLTDEERDVAAAKELFSMGALRIRDIIRIFGDRFGVKDDPDDTLLDQRYINGIPVTHPMPADQVEKALKQLQEKIIKVAIKNADDPDRDRDRDRAIAALLGSIEDVDRLD